MRKRYLFAALGAAVIAATWIGLKRPTACAEASSDAEHAECYFSQLLREKRLERAEFSRGFEDIFPNENVYTFVKLADSSQQVVIRYLTTGAISVNVTVK